MLCSNPNDNVSCITCVEGKVLNIYFFIYILKLLIFKFFILIKKISLLILLQTVFYQLMRMCVILTV